MLKAIFFDYHGVLDKRTFKFGMLGLIARESYNSASGITLDEYKEHIFNKYLKLSNYYSAGLIEPEEFWQGLAESGLNKDIIAHAKDYILTVEPDEELWAALPPLRQNYYLGILSDCSKDKLKSIHKNLELVKYFDAWHFSCDYLITKKDLKFFELMRTDGKFLREECLFVDDQEKIVNSAKSLGFKGLVFEGTQEFIQGLGGLA